MVRLKVFDMCDPKIFAFEFQFLMVRLKAKNWVIEDSFAFTFQFLMVRLKAVAPANQK